jgi:hypothetical protein
MEANMFPSTTHNNTGHIYDPACGISRDEWLNNRPDRPRITDDGTIWPVSRELMKTREHIIRRMAEDIKRLATVHGGVTEGCLRRENWTEEQIFCCMTGAAGYLHASNERERARSISKPAYPTSETRFERIATACLVMSLGLMAIGAFDLAVQYFSKEI